MRLAPQLKDLDVFIAGNRFAGQLMSYTRPTLTAKVESHLAAGMLSEVDLIMGLEPMETEMKFAGDQPLLNAEFANPRLDGSLVRYVGMYDAGAEGGVVRYEITTRGRYLEIDRGSDEKGSKSEATYKQKVVYYKEVVDGVVAFEIDVLAGIWIVNGVDLWQAIREGLN